MPSNTIVSIAGLGRPSAGLHVRDRRELHVVELAADPLDSANVHVLHEVPLLWIKRDRAARARPARALHGIDERFAAGTVRLLEALVDEVHAVVATDRHEVRAYAACGLLEGVDESLVFRAVVGRGIMVRGDGAKG